MLRRAAVNSGSKMDLFVTSESTIDVTHDELSVLLKLEEAFNGRAGPAAIGRIAHLAVVLIIMNPEVATPFPEGVIFRPSRSMLDIKLAFDFADWKRADAAGRVNHIIDLLCGVLEGAARKHFGSNSPDDLIATLKQCRVPR